MLTTPTANASPLSPTEATSVPAGGETSSAQVTALSPPAGTLSRAKSEAGSSPTPSASTTSPPGRRQPGLGGSSLAFVTTQAVPPSASTTVPRATRDGPFMTATTLG